MPKDRDLNPNLNPDLNPNLKAPPRVTGEEDELVENVRKPPKDIYLSDAGAAVLADREGMELTAYWDSVGVLTIGIGHTSAAGPPTVYEGMTITEDEAYEIFRADNQRFRSEALPLVHAPMYQHEFDAFASLLFNLGTPQFSGATFLARHNAQDYAGVPEAILWWNKPPEIMSRRKGEAEQYRVGEPYQARIP